MAQQEVRPTGGAAAGTPDPDDAEPDERLPDAEWILPAVLFLAAKGVRAFNDEGVWGWVAVGFGVLAAIATVAVIVTAVRRRAYETLITIAAGALFVGATAYVGHDLL
ncbi:hypothetical protein AGRA3207_002670 [Actinomadura graeca]|uniref:Uncharacterized protein n=1 Tax=Actinomadura graeca TaxID=2750812 RepID=A0ABX8QSU2_9ACTN|nr:hypothetical protein [Actinomadura graeca]QXJ21781.1 hypothetical protein AGRA3207_002670 [Actinomadura graeca]